MEREEYLPDYTDFVQYSREELEALKKSYESNIDKKEKRSPITKISNKFNIDFYSILHKSLKILLIILVIYIIIFAASILLNQHFKWIENNTLANYLFPLLFAFFIPLMIIIMLLELDNTKKDYHNLEIINTILESKYNVKDVVNKRNHNRKIVPIEGNWDISKWDEGESEITYLGPNVMIKDGTDPRNAAIALFEGEMEKGIINTKVCFLKEGSTIARIIIGYDSKTGSYYSIGIGGYRIAYLIDRFDPQIGWKAIYAKGNRNIIKRGRIYNISVGFDFNKCILKIDNTEIFRCELPVENLGKQVGLFSWGRGNVTFREIELKVNPPDIKSRKKMFHEPKDKISIATAAFENQDYTSVFNNLNTALELILKDVWDIPTTNTKISTSDIINIMIKYEVGPTEYLKEVRKRILSLDNKIKHQGYDPSQTDCINAIRSMNDLMGKIKKDEIIIETEIRKKILDISRGKKPI